MELKHTLQMLTNYEARADKQQKYEVAELIKYISSNPACFNRERKDGCTNIVASVFVVNHV